MSEVSEGAVARTLRLSGTSREMILAGFELGIEHAAQIIETCSDAQTDEVMAAATPLQCFEVASMLVRNQGGEALAALRSGGDLPASKSHRC